jgi:hypothetical protein
MGCGPEAPPWHGRAPAIADTSSSPANSPLLASSPLAARSCTEHTVMSLKIKWISLHNTDVAAFLLGSRSCSLLAHSCSLIKYLRSTRK